MKITITSALSSVITLLCLGLAGTAVAQELSTTSQASQAATQKKLPKNWTSDSRAVYDLLVAQFQHAGADYSGSVDALVKFAKTQKDDQLYAKAFKSLLQTERYADAVELTAIWQKDSSHDINRFYVLALTLNNDIDLALNELNKFQDNVQNDLQNESQKSKTTPAATRQLFPYVKVLLSQWYKPQVETLFSRLYQQDSRNELVNDTYTQLLRWQGKIDQAVAIIDKRRFDEPRNINLVQQKSDVYRYAVRLRDAEKVWQDFLADYPNEPIFRFAYAQYLYDCYRFSDAEAQLEKIGQTSLSDSVNQLKMMVLVQQGKFSEAETVFAKYFANGDDSERSRYALAELFLDKKAYGLAKKYLKPLTDFNKNIEKDWAVAASLKMGQALYATAPKDDLSEGDKWFDTVASQFRFTPEEKLQEQVNALQEADLDNVAYERLNAFLQATPNNEMIRYTRGLVAAEMGLESVAIDDLKMIYTTSPDNIDVQNALGYTLLSRDDTLDEGEKLVKKALFSKPASPAVVDSMGWVNYRRNHLEVALPYFRYAYGNYLDGEIIGHYILALYHSGRADLAKRLYQLEIQYPPNVQKINRHVGDLLPKLKD